MFENWPDLVPATKARNDLKMSPKKFYPLLKQPGFPSVRIGDKFYLIKSGFIKWLDEESKKDKSKVA